LSLVTSAQIHSWVEERDPERREERGRGEQGKGDGRGGESRNERRNIAHTFKTKVPPWSQALLPSTVDILVPNTSPK